MDDINAEDYQKITRKGMNKNKKLNVFEISNYDDNQEHLKTHLHVQPMG